MIILTEKPSVAKDIATALSGFTYNKDGYYTNSKNDCIVSAAGHLLTLFEPSDYDEKLKKWNLNDLPIIPFQMKYKIISETKLIFNKIKKCFDLFSTDKNFILATDAEREGELIGALILDKIGFTNYETAKRFWVSEALTPQVVKNGIKDAKPLSNYESYKNAGYARQHADWLIGINLSRLLSLQTGTFISFGRVQSAVLGAIYIRDKTIKNFISEKYNEFVITGKTKENKEIEMTLMNEDDTKCVPNGTHLKNVLECIENDKELLITDIFCKDEAENSPQLFNITGLQKDCSSKLKYSPAKTLSIAQSLYEDLKCLSYPRTPSKVLGDNNVDLFKSKFDSLKEIYPEYAQGCVIENITTTNKKIFNSAKLQDHHALIPLTELPPEATEEQRNVFFAVLERFFDCIKNPCKTQIATIIASPKTNKDIIFKTQIKKIISPGWKKELTNIESEYFFELQKQDIITISNHELKEKFTQPKKHFTTSTILSLMENPRNEEDKSKLVGIGTPATRASIIESLIQREFVNCDKKQNLFITDKGNFIIETILKIPFLKNLISIKTTTAWEEELNDNPLLFLSHIKKLLSDELPKINIETKWKKQQQTLGFCPVCKSGKILVGAKNFFCSNYKNNCNFTIWKTICNANVSDKDVINLLQGKVTISKKFKTKEGKEFKAKLKLNNEQKIEFLFK